MQVVGGDVFFLLAFWLLRRTWFEGGKRSSYELFS